jgi:hypothetical protein
MTAGSGWGAMGICLIPILYLKGISSGDFDEALVALAWRSSSAATAEQVSPG